MKGSNMITDETLAQWARTLAQQAYAISDFEPSASNPVDAISDWWARLAETRQENMERLREGLGKVFEHMEDLDWLEEGGSDFEEGYRQCLIDMCEILAEEWRVALPTGLSAER